MARAVWQHATDADYLTELTTWSGRYASLAGVPARNSPESDPTAPLHAVVLALGTTATAFGLASCPVTEPLEIPGTREAVQRDVFGDGGFPQMLLRVGWAPVDADPLARTPRRPLQDVVDWRAGADV